MKNIINITKIIKSPKVIIIKEFKEIDNVIKQISTDQPVIVNVLNLPSNVAFRIIDFLSGYVFALNGKSKKIDDLIYRFEI